jgi:hypothetical protein
VPRRSVQPIFIVQGRKWARWDFQLLPIEGSI